MGILGPNFRDLGHPAWLGELAKGPGLKPANLLPLFQGPEGPCSLRPDKSSAYPFVCALAPQWRAKRRRAAVRLPFRGLCSTYGYGR